MKWTTKTPATIGWYWHQPFDTNHSPYIVQIAFESGMFVVYAAEKFSFPMDRFSNGQWSSEPIPQPSE